MLIRKSIYQILVFAVAAMSVSFNVSAETKIKHVFELFTSQGCYSCPPADKLLGHLIEENDDILGLEFHVDYWDTLVYGSAGKWRDPFSDASYSKRQRDYNRLRLEGRKGVYTPQMIVDGRIAFVGSKAGEAKKLIGRDSKLNIETSAQLSDSGNVTITLDKMDDSGRDTRRADVWLVLYDKKHVTPVPSGENKGETLENFNVVREMRTVGKWRGKPEVIEAAVGELDENQNCAVIVQRYDLTGQSVAGPIIGAAVCQQPG